MVSLRVVEPESAIVWTAEPACVCRIGVVGFIPIEPHLPKAVDIAVMHPEDRIDRGSLRIRHQSEADIAALAADIDMNEVMWIVLHKTAALAAVREGRARPSDARWHGVRVVPDKCAEDDAAIERGVLRWHAATEPSTDEERVLRAIRHRLIGEFLGNGGRIGKFDVAVVPIGQPPIRGAIERDDRRADDLLEGAKIGAVPRPKIPGLMLALVPVTRILRIFRELRPVRQIAKLRPSVRVDPVDRRKEEPACFVRDWTLL